MTWHHDKRPTFFAKGDFHSEVADLSKISQLAMSRNLLEVATAIGRLAEQYIRFPGAQEINEIKEAFYCHSNMICQETPCCISC